MREPVSRFTTVRGVSLHSIESGEGAPTFILIHGLGASVLKWIEALPLLAAHGRTIAIDLPGFGRSDIPKARYSTTWLAGAVRAFMAERAIERAIIVGNSLGGTVAMRLAEIAPERCAGLVLVAPALPRPRGAEVSLRMWLRYVLPILPGVGELLYEGYQLLPAERRVMDSLRGICDDPSRVSVRTRELLVQEARDRVRKPDVRRAVFRAHRALFAELVRERDSMWRNAAKITTPTLIVWGDRDDIVPLGTGKRAARVIQDSMLVVMHGTGHVPQLDRPQEFTKIVTDWTARTPRTS